MLTDDVRRGIRELWNRFWSGGIANPLSAIEQISYLIFLKRLEDLDAAERLKAQRSGARFVSLFKGREECRWSYIREQPPDRMFSIVADEAFPFLKSINTNGGTFAAAMKDAIFIIPRPGLLAEAIRIIDELPVGARDNADASGDLYEDLLKELSLAGKNGQFRTARHVVRVVTELADPQLGEWVCDPAAGTAGFLVAAHQWILRSYTRPENLPQDGSWHNLTGELIGNSANRRALLDGKRFVGFDFDTTMVRLGLMNMLLHGIRHPEMRYQDTLSDGFEPSRHFDVVLANPPFTGSFDKSGVNRKLLKLQTSKTELLFLELCLALLKDGGRCAIIVPEGTLYNSSNAHRQIRERLMNENRVQAIVSLPSGCFRPYTGVKTSIVLVARGGRTEDVWFYEVTGDGYTLDDKRQDDPQNDDLRYVSAAFRILRQCRPEAWPSPEAEAIARKRTWLVPRDAITARNYSLSAGTYRPVESGGTAHENPIEILDRVLLIESEVRQKLERLRSLIDVGR